MKNKLFRLRLGIVLIAVSWLPIAQVILIIAHNHNKLMGDHASETFRAAVWIIQSLIGLVGLWLAGSVAIHTAKQNGWRAAPKNLWQLFRTGVTE